MVNSSTSLVNSFFALSSFSQEGAFSLSLFPFTKDSVNSLFAISSFVKCALLIAKGFLDFPKNITFLSNRYFFSNKEKCVTKTNVGVDFLIFPHRIFDGAMI